MLMIDLQALSLKQTLNAQRERERSDDFCRSFAASRLCRVARVLCACPARNKSRSDSGVAVRIART